MTKTPKQRAAEMRDTALHGLPLTRQEQADYFHAILREYERREARDKQLPLAPVGGQD